MTDKNEKEPQAGDAAADKNQGGAQESSGATTQAVPPYRPSGLPDHLFGASDKETLDKVWNAYEKTRVQMSKTGRREEENIPEKIEDYEVRLPEDLANKIIRVGEDGKDPVFDAMKTVFHRLGIPASKAAEGIAEFYKQSENFLKTGGDAGLAADFEFKSLGGADAAKPIIDSVIAGISGMAATGKLSDAAVQELTYLTAYGEGVSALREVLAAAGEKTIPAGKGTDGGAAKITKEVLDQRVMDPRYLSGTKQFDRNFYDETTRMFQEFYKS